MTCLTSEVPVRSRTVQRLAAMRFAGATIALVGLLAVALLHPTPVSAAPQLTNASIQTPDPSSLTFRVQIASDADLASATVNYKILNPSGPSVAGSLRVEVSGRTADASAKLETRNNERFVPIGTQFTYSWTVVDKNGATTTTAEQPFTFLDGRFQWQSKSDGRVTVFWYGDNQSNALQAMEAAATSIANNEALLNAKLTYPIRLVIWRSTTDSKAAQQQRGSTFDQQIVTGGARVSPDLLHIYIPNDFVDVVRHETAHIITKVAGDGTISNLPSWIDEGTAVYAQVTPGDGYTQDLKRAISADTLLRLRNMGAPSNQPNQVNLFYGESWAIVKFTVDTYGKDKFAGIFKSVKDGAPIDDALQSNIGVDQDGLYNAWRKSVGLKTIDFPPIPKASTAGAAQATQPPLGIPTNVTSAGTTGGAVSDAVGAVVPRGQAAVVATGAVVVALVLGFLAFRLARKS